MKIHRYPLRAGHRRPARLPAGVRLGAVAHVPAGPRGRAGRRGARLQPARPALPGRPGGSSGAARGSSSTSTTWCPSCTCPGSTAGEDFLYRAVCRLERRTYRAADVVIATNESYRDVALGRGGKQPDECSWSAARPAVERFHQVPPEPSRSSAASRTCLLPGRDGARRTAWTTRCGRWPSCATRSAATTGTPCSSAAATPSTTMVALSQRAGPVRPGEFTGRIPDEDLLRYLSTADVCLVARPAQPAQRRVHHEQDHGVHGDGAADRLVRPARGAGLGRRGRRLRAGQRRVGVRQADRATCWTTPRSAAAWARSVRPGSAARCRGNAPAIALLAAYETASTL